MKKTTLTTLLLLLAGAYLLAQPSGMPSPVKQSVFNVVDFGAGANDELKDGEAIQNTIDACAEEGGGTVYIPAGRFITGTLLLKSNINLYLESGAELYGSSDLEDYEVDGQRHGMIFAKGIKHVSITGNGAINGNDSVFFNWDDIHSAYYGMDPQYVRQGESYDNSFPDGPVSYDDRPGMMIVFKSCEDVQIRDVLLKNSPNWAVRFSECDNVVAENVEIFNTLLVPNSDGIHCTTSRNVRISNCDIRAGDDALIVTGFSNEIGVSGEAGDEAPEKRIGNQTGYAENVTVTNCVLKSRSSGIRVGYGENPIRNCVFQNIVIHGSNRGIGVFARDNANIEDILFNNITIDNRLHTGWWGSGEPLHVSAIPRKPDVPVGEIRNVQFANITADSETGMVFYGIEEGLIHELSLENIDLTIRDGQHSATFGGNFDLRPVADMEYAVFEHDVPGIYANNLSGLSVEGFSLGWGKDLEPFFTSAISLHHSNDILIDGFTGKQAPAGNAPAIELNEISNITIRNCKAKPGTGTFLHHRGLKQPGIFSNNELKNAGKTIVPGDHGFLMEGNLVEE